MSGGNVFTAPGLIHPDDDSAGPHPDPAAEAEYRELYRRWESVGLTPDQAARFGELKAARATGSPVHPDRTT